MKLGGTAAKRVKGSVKCTKPAQHCCRRVGGTSRGRRSGTGTAGGTRRSPPGQGGTAGIELGMGEQLEQEQGARWRKRSLKQRVFAPLVEEAAG